MSRDRQRDLEVRAWVFRQLDEAERARTGRSLQQRFDAAWREQLAAYEWPAPAPRARSGGGSA